MTGEAGGERRAARPRRVFFALELDARTAAALARAAEPLVAAAGGRPTARDNLHMTLAFLGGLRAEALERALAVPPIAVGPFELELARCRFLRRARVLAVAPHPAPAPLAALHERLWEGLVAAGFERERRPFRPHVTVARRSGPSRGRIEPIPWSVRELSLMESLPEDGGVRYRALARWPL